MDRISAGRFDLHGRVLRKRCVKEPVKRIDAPRGLARHFAGWQPGLLAVFIASAVAVLVVPRPVEPVDLPVPKLDLRELTRLRHADAARAELAERTALDVDVRKLGLAMREYGQADFDGDETALLAARKKTIEAARLAVAQGDEALLRLRAFQQRSFLREVRRWEETREATKELAEVGGGFLRLVERNGWVDASGHVLMTEGALTASFKKRWNEVSGIDSEALRISTEEQRALLAFVLLHPAASANTAAWGGARGAKAGTTADDLARLKKIDEIAKVDPSYPSELARGVIFYRLGRYLLAVESFRQHLDVHPDGPYALRAQNYLRAALGRAQNEQF
jgi:tetratricopeptide (TPR) repeat protein